MGTVVTVFIVIAIAAVAAFALRRTVRVARGKENCCGGSSRTPARRKPAPRRAEVADTNPSHYPHTTLITVRGMSCAGCTEAVADALNALPGTWATVDLETRTATVRTKEPADRETLERAIESAGYTIIRL